MLKDDRHGVVLTDPNGVARSAGHRIAGVCVENSSHRGRETRAISGHLERVAKKVVRFGLQTGRAGIYQAPIARRGGDCGFGDDGSICICQRVSGHAERSRRCSLTVSTIGNKEFETGGIVLANSLRKRFVRAGGIAGAEVHVGKTHRKEMAQSASGPGHLLRNLPAAFEENNWFGVGADEVGELSKGHKVFRGLSGGNICGSFRGLRSKFFVRVWELAHSLVSRPDGNV